MHPKIRVERGDITRIPADAIINAANSALGGGGGVDGAMARKPASRFKQLIDQLGVCPCSCHGELERLARIRYPVDATARAELEERYEQAMLAENSCGSCDCPQIHEQIRRLG